MELMGGLNTVAYGKREGAQQIRVSFIPATEIPPRKRSRPSLYVCVWVTAFTAG